LNTVSLVVHDEADVDGGGSGRKPATHRGGLSIVGYSSDGVRELLPFGCEGGVGWVIDIRTPATTIRQSCSRLKVWAGPRLIQGNDVSVNGPLIPDDT